MRFLSISRGGTNGGGVRGVMAQRLCFAEIIGEKSALFAPGSTSFKMLAFLEMHAAKADAVFL